MRQARLITTADLKRLLGAQAPSWQLGDVVADLVARGWLRPLPVRGTYEFLPAAGGPWESGDPWIELRAALENSSGLIAQVALGSAAFLRGFADRRSPQDTIIVNSQASVPPALRRTYRAIRARPNRIFGAEILDGLPVATPARMVLEAATWWQYAGNVMDDEHWIRPALTAAGLDELRAGAQRLGRVTTARCGFLARSAGNTQVEEALADLPRTRPVFFGPRPRSVRGVPFDDRWGVYVTLASAAAGRR